MLFSEDTGPLVRALIESIVQVGSIDWQKVHETLTRVLRVWCSDVDKSGGVSQQFEFDANVTPVCYVCHATLLCTNVYNTSIVVLVRADAAVCNEDTLVGIWSKANREVAGARPVEQEGLTYRRAEESRLLLAL